MKAKQGLSPISNFSLTDYLLSREMTRNYNQVNYFSKIAKHQFGISEIPSNTTLESYYQKHLESVRVFEDLISGAKSAKGLILTLFQQDYIGSGSERLRLLKLLLQKKMPLKHVKKQLNIIKTFSTSLLQMATLKN